MDSFEAEIAYSLPKELQWGILNDRLKAITNEVRELRILSCVVSIVLLVLVTNLRFDFLVVMSVGASGILWGMSFIYSVIPRGLPFGSYELHHSHMEGTEGFFMLLRELEMSYFAASKRQRQLRLLVAMSMFYTLLSMGFVLFQAIGT